MQYKEHHFQYEFELPEPDSEKAAESSSRKEYRRGRPFRSARRRGKKPVQSPGPGIGGRRNRRWSW
jgi:hypothetical protein